jgi:hypothetical protein
MLQNWGGHHKSVAAQQKLVEVANNTLSLWRSARATLPDAQQLMLLAQSQQEAYNQVVMRAHNPDVTLTGFLPPPVCQTLAELAAACRVWPRIIEDYEAPDELQDALMQATTTLTAGAVPLPDAGSSGSHDASASQQQQAPLVSFAAAAAKRPLAPSRMYQAAIRGATGRAPPPQRMPLHHKLHSSDPVHYAALNAYQTFKTRYTSYMCSALWWVHVCRYTIEQALARRPPVPAPPHPRNVAEGAEPAEGAVLAAGASEEARWGELAALRNDLTDLVVEAGSRMAKVRCARVCNAFQVLSYLE